MAGGPSRDLNRGIYPLRWVLLGEMETFGYHTVADSLRETARSLGRAAGHAAIPACEGGGGAESKTDSDNS